MSVHLLMITPELDLDHDTRGFIHGWVLALAARVGFLSVIALRVGRHDLPTNTRVYSLEYRRGHKAAAIWRFSRLMTNLMSGGTVTGIFVHMMPKFGLLAAPWARWFRQPLVLWYTHGHVSPILRLAHYLADRVVTASAEGFRIPGPKRVITGHGIDLALFTPGPERLESTVRFLFVGRISPVKQLHILLEAMDRLRVAAPLNGVHLRIVGGPFWDMPADRSYLQELEQQRADLGLGDLVTFTGPVPYRDIGKEYAAADIFVNTSRTGSLDKTGLEAMASGLSVITCNESYADLLAADCPWCLVDTNESAILAAAMARLMAMPAQERRSLGLRLRERVAAAHGLNRLMDQLVDLFRSLS